MSAAKSFEDLLVWRKAHEFVLLAYSFSVAFPRQEMYGLCSQFRRAAVSVPANIAEGFRRRTVPDKAHFLTIAEGSLEECLYYITLARDLGYNPDTEEIRKCGIQARKLICAYRKSIFVNTRNWSTRRQ